MTAVFRVDRQLDRVDMIGLMAGIARIVWILLLITGANLILRRA